MNNLFSAVRMDGENMINEPTLCHKSLIKNSMPVFYPVRLSQFCPMEMDEELKNRFMQQMLQDLLHDDTKPFPTLLCEMEETRIVELVRKCCLFSDKMVPFKVKHQLNLVSERLEIQRKSIDYGMLYIEVFVN